MNKKIFAILLLTIVAFSSLTLVCAADLGNFEFENFTVDAPINSVFDGYGTNLSLSSSGSSFSFDSSDLGDSGFSSSSDSQDIFLKFWEDKVNKIVIEDVSEVKNMESYIDWEENKSDNISVFVNPFATDDFFIEDSDAGDSDHVNKEDLKYAVLLDDGSHKFLFYGNDLTVLKKMASSLKFK